jgi:1-phosphofructokinase
LSGILVAGPNLTLDRVLSIEELVPGEVLRATEAVVAPGGKGVNVARVARALGMPAVLAAFVPGRTGQVAAELLAEEPIELDGVPVGGELRSAAVILERGGRVTVLNEPGPPLAAGDWEAYEKTVERRQRGRLLVCSGSLPPGAPGDGYARLARRAQGQAIVDASGPTLEAALEAGAIVAPNLAEAAGVLGWSDGVGNVVENVRERAMTAAAQLRRLGAAMAIVTAGEAGAAAGAAEGVWWQPAPTGAVVRNPVGAGDSFTAGLAAALVRGEPLRAAIEAGVATATASVETPLPARVNSARVAELRSSLAPVS